MHAEEELLLWIISRDNPYVKALLEVYREFNDEENVEPLVNNGVTYATYLPCAVEIEPQFWKTIPFHMPAGHGSAHHPDECVSVDGLLDAIELMAEMFLECGKVLQSV